jgi:hypothetical protein
MIQTNCLHVYVVFSTSGLMDAILPISLDRRHTLTRTEVLTLATLAYAKKVYPKT